MGGGKRVELLEFCGHTSGDTVVYLPDARVVVSGDLVATPDSIPQITNYADGGNWTDMVQTLDTPISRLTTTLETAPAALSDPASGGFVSVPPSTGVSGARRERYTVNGDLFPTRALGFHDRRATADWSPLAGRRRGRRGRLTMSVMPVASCMVSRLLVGR